jgi:hypothetical protein
MSYTRSTRAEYGPYRRRDAPETIEVLDAKSGEVIGTATRLDS